MKNNFIWKQNLRWKTLQAIKQEFSSYPCLGLVSEKNPGCHEDMKIDDFKKSYQVFRPLLTEIEKKLRQGEIHRFADLRAIGKKYEDLMLQKTNGINTQKNLIFSLSIFYWALLNDFSYLAINKEISDFCQPLMTDLELNDDTVLKLYHENKVKGTQHIALDGFDIVFLAYDYYQKFLKWQNLKTHELIFAILIFLTVNLEDPVLINEIGAEKWEATKKEYQQLLNQIKIDYHRQISYINQINNEAITNKISPSGASDLTVLTLILIKINY